MLLSINKKFFFKNLIILLVALSLPVILLSFSLYSILQTNIKELMNNNNENILVQIKDNIEMIIDNTDALNLTFSSNPEMIGMLKQVLNEQYNSNFTNYSQIIKSLLISSLASRPYIHSIYIYSDNDNKRFMTNNYGLVSIRSFFDTSWYDSYLKHQNDQRPFWNDSRVINQYSFEEKGTEVITFYKLFFSEKGLVVLNISKSYLEQKINGLNLSPNQIILIVDPDNRVVLQNREDPRLTPEVLDSIFTGDISYLDIDKEKYYITKVSSEKYNWKYISIIPLSSLYIIPNHLGSVMILLLLVSIVFCILLAFIITRRNYNNVSTVIAILDQAETETPFPLSPPAVRDEYDFIIQKILNTYLEQNSLKTELMEKQYKMRILEMTALQAQINPHFLFNTLKAIFWMSFQLTNSKNEVGGMIENLSNILYYSMGGQTDLVSFDEEIQNTKNYIEIEQTRYKDKFDVIWEYPDHIGSYYTIKLLIQPLVENSILHGLRNRETKGCIKIKLIEQKDGLRLYVTDNGCGIGRDELARINAKLQLREDDKHHIGIYNCNRRISLAFGEYYGIHIQSKTGCGTSVTVRLPANREGTKSN